MQTKPSPQVACPPTHISLITRGDARILSLKVQSCRVSAGRTPPVRSRAVPR